MWYPIKSGTASNRDYDSECALFSTLCHFSEDRDPEIQTTLWIAACTGKTSVIDSGTALDRESNLAVVVSDMVLRKIRSFSF